MYVLPINRGRSCASVTYAFSLEEMDSVALARDAKREDVNLAQCSAIRVATGEERQSNAAVR